MIGQTRDDVMKAMPGSYYIFVQDVDSTFKTAIERGADKIFEPTDMPCKDRQAGISGPSGNAWWISRRLVEEPYDA